jgi:hypothetical protein
MTWQQTRTLTITLWAMVKDHIDQEGPESKRWIGIVTAHNLLVKYLSEVTTSRFRNPNDKSRNKRVLFL